MMYCTVRAAKNKLCYYVVYRLYGNGYRVCISFLKHILLPIGVDIMSSSWCDEKQNLEGRMISEWNIAIVMY